MLVGVFVVDFAVQEHFAVSEEIFGCAGKKDATSL